jgi:hypothetical protein
MKAVILASPRPMRCHTQGNVQSPALKLVGGGQCLSHAVDQGICCDTGQADCCDNRVFGSVDHPAPLVSDHDEVLVYEVANVGSVKYDREVVARARSCTKMLSRKAKWYMK